MSRCIDRQSTHPSPWEMKLILLSSGRNGILSSYYALKTMGYSPDHQLEVFRNGVPHIRTKNDAVRASSQGRGRPFSREGFVKWLGGLRRHHRSSQLAF
ncbi:hypothetical protein ColTof4_02600 [Colletotrichum tofieldiae]|nr:hypothetical protein ColTof3_09107 [Colletotrichum tofieldiae]GKT70177.1 hypothetical protein ColTof4_02600 [Colletotrichum tofieldiae]